MLLILTILIIEILSGMEMDLFLPSYPELQKTFHLSPALVQLTITLNFVALAFASPYFGIIGDRFNRRKVILFSLIIFVIGSLLCMLAQHFYVLLLGRVLQGIGMAGAMVLSYPILADQFSLKTQVTVFGVLNGMLSICTAFAPVLGSYVTLYFHWRKNFLILFLLGLISLLTSYFFIPNHQGNSQVSLSLRGYIPLLRSWRLIKILLMLAFLALPYWVFIAMLPILFLETLKMPLMEFGYYLMAEAIVYAVASITMSLFLKMVSDKACMRIGIVLCVFSIMFTLMIVILKVHNPFIILMVLISYTIAYIIPFNLTFPLSMAVVPDSKGRAKALGFTSRMLLASVVLQVVSYFYAGTFFPIGLNLIFFLTLAICLIKTIET